MNAIILAAGIGKRLGNLTIKKPKCLTEINGRTILHHTLDNLEASGFTRVIIMIGYLGKKVVKEIGDTYGGMAIEYIENEIYARTNSMYSLWLARKYLHDGALVVEGDCICEKQIIKNVMQLPQASSYWVVDKFISGIHGCMLTTDDSNRIEIIQIVREKLPEYKNNFFKSCGMVKVAPEYGKHFSKWLDEDVALGNIDIYYDLVLAKHVGEVPLYVYRVGGLKWCEVDDLNDLKRAQSIFK